MKQHTTVGILQEGTFAGYIMGYKKAGDELVKLLNKKKILHFLIQLFFLYFSYTDNLLSYQ